jgi:hypothetical protein
MRTSETLPREWIEALALVDEASRASGAQYVVVGGLGMAVSMHAPFCSRRGDASTAAGARRDLDLFVIADIAARARFRGCLQRLRPRDADPKVDLVGFYHTNVHFDGETAWLGYRDVARRVDPGVFTPFFMTLEGVRVPVLHPLTHSHMLWLHFAVTPRLQRQSRALWRGSRDGWPGWPEARFRPFHAFRRAKLHRFPLRRPISLVRGALYDWEADGHVRSLVRAKRYARERWPALAAWCRRRLD